MNKKNPLAPPPPQQLQIEIDPKQAEGVYSNAVLIAHSDSEFILDFARQLPAQQKARIHARIIMNPKACKMFLSALADNINKFESKFGPIKKPETTPIMMSQQSDTKH